MTPERKKFLFASLFILGLLATAYLSADWYHDVMMICFGAGLGVAVSFVMRRRKQLEDAKASPKVSA